MNNPLTAIVVGVSVHARFASMGHSAGAGQPQHHTTNFKSLRSQLRSVGRDATPGAGTTGMARNITVITCYLLITSLLLVAETFAHFTMIEPILCGGEASTALVCLFKQFTCNSAAFLSS